MPRTFNSSILKTSNEPIIPNLNKKCTGRNCETCKSFKEEVGKTKSQSVLNSLFSKWDRHIDWDNPCSVEGCPTCDYMENFNKYGGPDTSEQEKLKNLGILTPEEVQQYSKWGKIDFSKWYKHLNSREPEVNFAPLNYGVPRLIPSEDHPTGFIGEDPHSKYTETVAFVTDNPFHSCDRCMPICEACGTRDTPGRIKNGIHTSEFAAECRRRQQGIGFIPNYN
jgi:hypothetical protein